MQERDFFTFKAASLLSTPPNYSLGNDERSVNDFVRKVLENTILKGADAQIGQLTSLARSLATNEVPKKESKIHEIRLKNPFNPKFETQIQEITRSMDDYISQINSILSAIGDERLAYTVLYAIYETAWIRYGQHLYPERKDIPIYSTFDVSYATASMANWAFSGKPDGILLAFDFGGVQSYISKSRKLFDLWISSYLASVMSWSLIWKFVKKLGPDVVVSPSLRDNAFFYHSLIAELNSSNLDPRIISELIALLSVTSGYDPSKERFPRYAVIPAIGVIVLPDGENLTKLLAGDEKSNGQNLDLEKYVNEINNRKWETIFNTVEQEILNLKEDFGEIGEAIHRLLEYSKQFNFDKVSPLPLRVAVVRVSEIMTSSRHIYNDMYREVQRRKAEKKYFKSRPEEMLRLYDMTLSEVESWPEKEKSKRGFDFCSVCGMLPAILIMPNDSSFDKRIPEKLRVGFSRGERLCPYCTVKRLLFIPEILVSVLNKLLGTVAVIDWHPRFPSVSDVAVFTFRKSLINKASSLKGRQQETIKLEEHLNNVFLKIPHSVRQGIDSKAEPVLRSEKLLCNELSALGGTELKEYLEMVLFGDAEQLILDAPMRDQWSRLIRDVNQDRELKTLGLTVQNINQYYAIIRCDGDYMGAINLGDVERGFNITPANYAKALGIQSSDFFENNNLILYPVYHTTVSRALVATALRDARIVEENNGFVIYSGGDDLLAVSPAENSLSTVAKLRKNYSFFNGESPFEKRNNYLIPCMVTAGRSFCLYITHFMFPMYISVRRSSELLDAAKELRIILNNSTYEKDALVLAYNARGNEEYTFIPLRTLNSSFGIGALAEFIEEILHYISEKEIFSSSIVNDLNKNVPLLKLMIQGEPLSLFRGYLQYIIKRNVHRENKEKEAAVSELVDKLASLMTTEFAYPQSKNMIEEFLKSLSLYSSGLRGV